MSAACNLCGETVMCACVVAECVRCGGEGSWEEGPLPARSIVQIEPEYETVTCPDCEGAGEIKCDGPRAGTGGCPYESKDVPCYCEAAWDRQQEANASEPPASINEQHRAAWEERQALRSGRPM